MIKKLMLGASLSALMLSGAFAQSPNAPASPSSPPAAATPSTPSDSTPAPAKADAVETKAASGKADMVMSQKPDQYLASKFKGTDVLGADGKKIGSVGDILFDKDGKIEAYVVSIGGFLGMGAKEVALAPASFDVVKGDNGGADKLKVSLTQDELKQAQDFARYEPPRPTTTGSATGGGPGGMRPSTNTPPTSR